MDTRCCSFKRERKMSCRRFRYMLWRDDWYGMPDRVLLQFSVWVSTALCPIRYIYARRL
ncbi:hypothetical protein HETIRDRAFT_324460 [Heterobasidion irregulare TC 32-1]|uniref:Uncharacterized protein n=1 Tax=Heterobasidion irregulare (strain TC 32-1) TaxID=747525 RepID=W4K0L3_HETIT|nr:uncharacterized protein HETIRDRAFT_324460 [Heterobasidion irregulare TC 32-1]ETW79358.1 hypothetical protein HETIRDRAFT_324460 [Heterobasidion irregulare TC 32-1]